MLTLLLAGCDADRTAAPFDVRGTVTFDGRPMPSGLIYFDPDAAAGNDAAQGFATIRDGSYDTRRTGKGIKGGAYKVRIVGFDAQRDAPGTFPRPLFGEYTVAVEFPRETATRDFAVPASAGENLPEIPARMP